jgi:fructose-specific component phosphotransferase system IIB-like protein
LFVKLSSRTHKSIKKSLVLILTIVITTVQISTGIIPLQQVRAQDPIFDLPPSQNPDTIPVGGANNASIINGTQGNLTDTFDTGASNLTDTLGGNVTDQFGAPLGGNVTDQFGPAGTEGFDTGGAAGTEGFDTGGADTGGAAGTEGFAGGLNETVPETPSPPPPPTTKILSNNTGDSTNPNVAVSENHMFAAWEDTTSGNREILFISSSDGKNFTTVQNLSHTTGDSLNPKLAVSGKNVYVVWEDIADTGGGQIMFAKSSANGANFTSAKNLGNITQDSANPDVAVSGNNVYVVWESVGMNSTAADASNSEVMFAKSSNNGANFTSAKNLSNSAGNSANPDVAVSGNNVYVVWEDNSAGGTEIILARSTNGGANFGPSRNLSNSLGESFDPRIAISGSNVYVVWVDYSLGNSTRSDIMLIRSTSGGANFASAENLSNSPGEASDPRIAVSESNVYVVWEDTTPETGNGEIKFARSSDGGATFASVKNLSNNNGISFDPRIAVSESNVYVVWEDTTTTTAEGSSDIFLARSANNGATFGKVQNLSNNPVESFNPYMATFRGKLFVIWSDDKEGDAEIVFTDKTRNIASPEEEGGEFGPPPLPPEQGGTEFGPPPLPPEQGGTEFLPPEQGGPPLPPVTS